VLKYLFIIVGASINATMLCAQRPVDTSFVSIFNGQNLDGWKGDSVYWRVEDGLLTGEVTPETLLKKNSFIIWQGQMPDDFELKVDYRVSAKGNSGINYRSVKVDGEPFALKGYQADLDGEGQWNGQNYEERGRTFLAKRGQVVKIEPGNKVVVTSNLGFKEDLQKFVNREDWNEYHLIIKGNRLQHFINGKLMSEVVDEDTVNRKFSGLLGVQVHVGPPMKIEYKNLRIRKIL